ncbi:M20 family metallopeptidase [Anaerosalibacter massiliensis]|uniref:M20/M25/M40 family metallo-hydrolase n=1 Tax=Anaerosalibacter massiliensis TaxID=1347392 RepID=A0A9X2MJI6_9FIRM|nr:M20/M25/M40 family metallo-hydrolase [Anaerosalibacter massiliensis]MCR2045185.1 M20/M25/M40 family metallo-hydrolase [Anaerosalibacter massiliensis]
MDVSTIYNINKYINRFKVEKLLTKLIGIYSPYLQEQEAMNYVYSWLKEKDIAVKYHNYTEDKILNYKGINVIGRIKGQKKGPVVLLNGHLDTVKICEGWTREPLKATIEGDRLYGLGALDMKSGVVAIMLALEAFVNTVGEFNGEVLYTLVSDEEGPYGLGTDSLILDGITDDVDVAIVTEPSSGFTGIDFPCLCLGARGGWSYTVEFIGKSAHAANPEEGISAINDAAKVLLELEKVELKEDEKLGKGSNCVIGISGGGAACSVADKAEFTIFRHIVRHENKEYIINEINKAIKRANIRSKTNIKFRQSPHEDNGGFQPYIVDKDNPYTKIIQQSIKEITNTEATISYFSSIGDFNYLGSRVNVPTFVFGPSGANYHTADEYVLLDTVVETSQIIYDFLVKTLVKDL